MTESEAASGRALCTLVRAPGLGPRRVHPLLEEYGSAEAVIAAPPGALRAAGVPAKAMRRITAPDRAALEADLAWSEADNHHLIGWGDPLYPSFLAGIEDPPIALFVTGDVTLLSVPQVALVGARRASATGHDIAGEFAAHLAGAGYIITSGLALGIDAAAHAGALEAGGKTVAVLGTGPDRIYPKRNAELREKIIDTGALVSEFPPGTPPLAEHFPRRNRIISALAQATVVIEADRKSTRLNSSHVAISYAVF